MNAKKLALAAALLVAVACASDKTTEPEAAKPAPEPPADVAHLVQEAPPDGQAAPAPTLETTPQVEDLGLASLEPTGEFISPSRSEVSPKMPGRVARVYVDEGSRVGRGQNLLTLETDYIRLDIQRAEAELARAKAAEDEARRDFERKKGLVANESIPQATYDRSQGTYEQARAARTAAEVALSTAKQRLSDSVLRSPMTGVVAERRTEVGEHLGEAGVAFVIVQTAPLRLRFSVPERYLGEIRTGQRVTATVEPYPGETFTGTIQTVGGVIDPANRTFFAEAEFPNADGRLRPGLFARVKLEPSQVASKE
ncbi:MAG TPA: efflux RND transporter periplasmic adaptor subunit [Thermoanaerobaculia bacterium]|nr:efflux RND transporter periplasmic adaptor subunit [Thermoanaerobaculia bacterium]